jgi:hypothetical protein
MATTAATVGYAQPASLRLQLDTPNLRHCGYNWIRPTCVTAATIGYAQPAFLFLVVVFVCVLSLFAASLYAVALFWLRLLF